MDLKTLLQERYDTDAFLEFINERFDGFDAINSPHTDEDLSEGEKRDIESYRYLGSAELEDGSEIGFFEFRSRYPHIENKRVGFGRILKKLAADLGLDGALAAFYHLQSDVWRLSFVGFEYDDGRAQVTNLKRYTYLLGKGVPITTAYSQLKKLHYPKSIDEIKEIFSVEPVTKEFFQNYVQLFMMLNDYIKQSGQFGYFDNDDSKLHLFTKRLLGRIVFLYFLQKKGWLGVPKNGRWGEGDRRFLQSLFAKAQKNGQNYYDEYLKEIFFEALSQKRPDDYFAQWDVKIPFLNGGLFEADEFDKASLYLENHLFGQIFETFDNYNFTIIEGTPDDIEVAIDPEMLGRVFENLLEENYRKGKGAYYTPRPIVHYMCQQSLIDYLANKFQREPIEALIVKKETDNDYIIRHGPKIKEYLLSAKILDPAIGSGAFPMGLLHEIVSTIQALDKTMEQTEVAKLKREVIENSIYGIDIDPSAVEIAKLRFWLSLVVDEDEPTPLPNLYYKIMGGNSLLESILGDDPLTPRQSDLFDDRLQTLNEIKGLIHKFYNTFESNQKEALKKSIEDLIETLLNKQIAKIKDEIDSTLSNISVHKGLTKKQQELIELLQEKKRILTAIKKRPTAELFFYKIYFYDALITGGFDIVIGNPPYIRQESIPYKHRLKLERFYNMLRQGPDQYECYDGTADIYVYFIEKGFKLLSQNGILSYITSNKYTRAKYGKKLRSFLLDRAHIKEFIDLNDVKVFESATVDTAILSLSHKKDDNPQILYCKVGDDYKKDQDLYDYVKKHTTLYPQNALSPQIFSFVDSKEVAIKKRIEAVGTPLKEWDIKINYGIKTGLNDAFVIDEKTKNELIAKDPKSTQIIKPLLRGRDIDRYVYHFANKWLIALFPSLHIDIDHYPAVKEHLMQYMPKLKQTGETFTNKDGKKEKTRKKTNNKWFETQDQIAYWQDFGKEKIVWQRVTKSPRFSFVDPGVYILDSMAFFTVKDKFLLAPL
ncbi:MAG: hypothetical protein GXO16_08490, partial [Epsilonproteobacteria bacterium]|nr:hypothetical protein [Campylobacterota bacterium]